MNDKLKGQPFIEFEKQKSEDAPHRKTTNGRCVYVGDAYEKLGRVGQGTYGIVYKAKQIETNQFVALKRCLPHDQSSNGFRLTTLREIATLKTLRHPNIVELKDVAVSNNGVFLVFEYCQHDLAHLVDTHFNKYKKSPFREPEVKRLMIQLTEACAFMHKRHLVHRDIKLSNLLYNSQGELKLADFGLSRKFPSADDEEQPLTGKVVSLWYRPPEILFGSNVYDEGVDNWGVGCVFAELLTGKPLLDGKSEEDQQIKMFDLLGKPTIREWPDLYDMPFIRDEIIQLPSGMPRFAPAYKSLLDRFSHLSVAGLTLLQSMLAYHYPKRCTCAQALQSSYFTEKPVPVSTRHMPRFPPKYS